MAFQINDDEREALAGLRYLTRCLYYAGIRPYMDYKTRLVGVKRKISWQSLSEELYIEPMAGINKSETGSPSKWQIRRAAKELERNGLIVIKSTAKNLIFECVLASADKSVQNKAATRPQHHPATLKEDLETENNDIETCANVLGRHPKNAQAATPQISGNNKENITTNVVIQKKRKTQIPDEFSVTQKHLDYANKHQCPSPHDEIEKFKNYHIAKGSLFLDWDRAFYSWLLKAKEYSTIKVSHDNYSRNSKEKSRAIKDRLWESLANANSAKEDIDL